MKALKQLLVAVAFLAIGTMQAQVKVDVNIGTPPAWGPAGYTDVRYYFIPDIQTYYDVNTSEYIYLTNGKWMRVRTLPTAYRRYDLYNGYKVVLTDYRGATPYVNYKTHKVKYPKGYKGKPQKTIGMPPGQAKKLAGQKLANTNTTVKVKHPHDNANGKSKGKGKKH